MVGRFLGGLSGHKWLDKWSLWVNISWAYKLGRGGTIFFKFTIVGFIFLNREKS
jgi:hypothetical protein